MKRLEEGPHAQSCRGRARMVVAPGSAPGAAGPSGPGATRHRCAAEPRRQSGRGRRRHAWARRGAGNRAAPPSRCAWSASGFPLAGRASGGWYAGRARGARRVDGSAGRGAGARRGWHASRRDRRRPAGASRHAAAWRLAGRRACRVWPGRRGARASTPPARGHRASGLAQRLGAPVPGQAPCARDDPSLTRGGHGLAKCFGSRLHIPVQHALPILIQEAEGPGGERAGRCHHHTCAAWWSIACGLLRCLRWCAQRPQSHGGMSRRGPP